MGRIVSLLSLSSECSGVTHALRQPSLPTTFSCLLSNGRNVSFILYSFMNSFYLDVSIILHSVIMMPTLHCYPNSVILTSKKIYLKSVLCLDFKKMHYEFQSVLTDIIHSWAWREEILVIEFLSCSRVQHCWTWILGLVCQFLQKRKSSQLGFWQGLHWIYSLAWGILSS